MTSIEKCPKCGGQMLKDGEEGHCFQCGYRPEVKPVIPLPLPSARKEGKPPKRERSVRVMETIAQCHICNRYFKKKEMNKVHIVGSLSATKYICIECWAKIETGSGAEEPGGNK